MHYNKWGEVVEDNEDRQQLERWQETVDAFGGVGAAGSMSIDQQLAASNLGSFQIARNVAGGGTSQAFAVPAQQIVLAEMKLDRARPIDVSILPNLVPNLNQLMTPWVGSIVLTWGSEQGVQNQAEVDIGRGWRYPFTCSYMRVEWNVLGNASMNPSGGLPTSTPVDLGVRGMISPAAGGHVAPLTKTVWYQTIALGGNQRKVIPNWARRARVNCGVQLTTMPMHVNFEDPSAVVWGAYFAAANADRFSTSSLFSTPLPVPQMATAARIVSDGVGQIFQPAIEYELAL